MNTPQEAVVITCRSAFGRGNLSVLAAHVGAPCAAESGGRPVWAEQRTGESVSLFFALPAPLKTVLGSGSIELNADVSVSIGSCQPSALSLQGPGASFWAMMQTVSGMAVQSLPSLPSAWVSAIGRAAGGEQLAPRGATAELAAGFSDGRNSGFAAGFAAGRDAAARATAKPPGRSTQSQLPRGGR
jgi:hypothetical protein